jgi:hypothetical protein
MNPLDEAMALEDADEDVDEEEHLAPPLGAAAAVGGHKTISFFGAWQWHRCGAAAAAAVASVRSCARVCVAGRLTQPPRGCAALQAASRFSPTT